MGKLIKIHHPPDHQIPILGRREASCEPVKLGVLRHDRG